MWRWGRAQSEQLPCTVSSMSTTQPQGQWGPGSWRAQLLHKPHNQTTTVAPHLHALPAHGVLQADHLLGHEQLIICTWYPDKSESRVLSAVSWGAAWRADHLLGHLLGHGARRLHLVNRQKRKQGLSAVDCSSLGRLTASCAMSSSSSAVWCREHEHGQSLEAAVLSSIRPR